MFEVEAGRSSTAYALSGPLIGMNGYPILYVTEVSWTRGERMTQESLFQRTQGLGDTYKTQGRDPSAQANIAHRPASSL